MCFGLVVKSLYPLLLIMHLPPLNESNRLFWQHSMREFADRQFNAVIIDEAAQALGLYSLIYPIIVLSNRLRSAGSLFSKRRDLSSLATINSLPLRSNPLIRRTRNLRDRHWIKQLGKLFAKSNRIDWDKCQKAKGIPPPPVPLPNLYSGAYGRASGDGGGDDKIEPSSASTLTAKKVRQLGILYPSKF